MSSYKINGILQNKWHLQNNWSLYKIKYNPTLAINKVKEMMFQLVQYNLKKKITLVICFSLYFECIQT